MRGHPDRIPTARLAIDHPLVQAEATCVQDMDEPANDNDVRLVKAASVARAEVFVTGDKRVLIWGREGNMKILSLRDA